MSVPLAAVNLYLFVGGEEGVHGARCSSKYVSVIIHTWDPVSSKPVRDVVPTCILMVGHVPMAGSSEPKLLRAPTLWLTEVGDGRFPTGKKKNAGRWAWVTAQMKRRRLQVTGNSG